MITGSTLDSVSCASTAAGGRPDTQMLKYLNEAGVGLKNPNTSLGSPQTAMSKAIEQGPVQNVKYLHDLGCSYPERHRASFHMIFENTAKSEFNSHWWTNSINDFDLASTQSEPWKKLTFLILNGVIEVSFLREQLSRRGIRKHVIDSFWSSFEKAYAEREKIVDSNELSDLDDRPDVDVEVIQRMYDNTKKLVTSYRVKIREKF